MERHDGQLFATYSLAKNWGATANYEIVSERNDELSMATLNLSVPSVSFNLPRHKKTNNATANLWYAITERFILSGGYGFMRTSADQSIIFIGPTPGSNTGSNYTSQSQLFSLNAVYHHDEALDLSLALQQVRSYAQFAPNALTLLDSAGRTLDTTGITDVSRTDTVENSLAFRADYRMTKNLSCSANYSYRDYHDRALSSLSGTVHAVTASLSGNW
jgi:hypothetical protein